MKINFWTEFKNRWNSSSPIFFKKLQTAGLAATGLGTALVAIPAIPDNIQKIAGYLLTAGAMMAFVSKFAVQSPNYTTLDQKGGAQPAPDEIGPTS